MLLKIEEDERKVAEMRHKQYLMHQEKLKIKKEQEVRKMALQAAFEKMRKTKRWEPPPGFDIDIDIRELEMRAEEMVLRGKHSNTNLNGSNSFSSATATATPASRGNSHMFGTDRQPGSNMTQIPSNNAQILTRERPHTAPQQRRGSTDLTMPMIFDRDGINSIGNSGGNSNHEYHDIRGENFDQKRHGGGSVIPATSQQHEHDKNGAHTHHQHAHSRNQTTKQSSSSSTRTPPSSSEDGQQHEYFTHTPYSQSSPAQKSGNPHAGYLQPSPPASRSANQRPASAHVRGRLANSHNAGIDMQINSNSNKHGGSNAGVIPASVQSSINNNNNNNSSNKITAKKPTDGFSNSSNRYNAGQKMLMDSDSDNHEKTTSHARNLQNQQPIVQKNSQRPPQSRSRSSSLGRRTSTAHSRTNGRAPASRGDSHDQNAYQDYAYNNAPAYDTRQDAYNTAKNVIYDDARSGSSGRGSGIVDAWRDHPQPANALQNAVIRPPGKSRKYTC